LTLVTEAPSGAWTRSFPLGHGAHLCTKIYAHLESVKVFLKYRWSTV